MLSSREPSWTRNWVKVSYLLHWQVGSLPPGKHLDTHIKPTLYMLCLLLSYVQLWNPLDGSTPGSSWGFSRQEYWSGLPCPPPGDLPNPKIKPRSPVLKMDSLLSEPPGKPYSSNEKQFLEREWGGNFLVVQWLGLRYFHCWGSGFNPWSGN